MKGILALKHQLRLSENLKLLSTASRNFSIRRDDNFPKGSRVAFHRMIKGPKRYLALFDSYIWRENIDAALRITRKAHREGIILDIDRSEQLIDLLAGAMRMKDLEGIVSSGSFKVSINMLISICKPLILSGKANVFSEQLHRFISEMSPDDLDADEVEFEELRQVEEIARNYRLSSFTPLSESEEEGIKSTEQAFQALSSILNGKRRYRGYDSVWGNSAFPNQYYVEDRSTAAAPELKLHDLTAAFSNRTDGLYLLHAPLLWHEEWAYRLRNIPIMPELIRSINTNRRKKNNIGKIEIAYNIATVPSERSSSAAFDEEEDEDIEDDQRQAFESIECELRIHDNDFEADLEEEEYDHDEDEDDDDDDDDDDDEDEDYYDDDDDTDDDFVAIDSHSASSSNQNIDIEFEKFCKTIESYGSFKKTNIDLQDMQATFESDSSLSVLPSPYWNYLRFSIMSTTKHPES